MSARWLGPFRRSSLSIKLAALGATVTGAVVVAAFWGLSVKTRNNTREVFAAQLTRNQQTLENLQERTRNQLLFTVSLIAEGPAFQYSLKQFQVEANRGTVPDPTYVVEMQRHLDQLSESARADILVLTDDSARVFAAAGSGEHAVERGASLATLDAVKHALDPNAPASAELAVLRTSSGYFQVAVIPLIQDGFTLGALLFGERLDTKFVAAARATSDADIVLLAGNTLVAMSDTTMQRDRLAAVLAARATANAGSTIRVGDEEFMAAPVSFGETQDQQAVRLWILQPLSRQVARLMQPLRREFELFGALAVIVAAFGAAFVARSVLGPFTRFVAYMRSGAATEQRQGRFDSDDESVEVRTLNESFNQLMDSISLKRRALEERTAELAAANVVLTDEISERTRVERALRESEAQLRQSQKLEAIGTLAGGIAHDFNNLITVISGYTQLALMRTDTNSSAADDLRQVVDASDRAANLTHQLLAFSRKQVLQPTVLDLSDVVSGIAPMLRRIIGEHIVLRIENSAPLARIRADKGQLEQVLLNLAVNARDAMPSGGHLTIATSNGGSADRATAREVALVVSDTGIGMSDEVKERVFEPFFTTKEAGKGTGLGLSMVYGIVNQSGGRIAFESDVGTGTAFIITLPAAESVGVAEDTIVEAEDRSRGTESILIVEDAEDVRTLARRTLEERGYTVRVARNAAEALEISAAGRVDLLLTDIVMPQTSGPQLVATYLATRPVPAIVYMSGYADDALDQYELDPKVVFLRKPFTPSILARTIRETLNATRGATLDVTRDAETKRGEKGVDSAAD
ncbi:MAG TPA: ATP-binding protein [Gemmatimonadaceae bacterium]|jgi:signal transduction histidine kinase